MKKRPVSVSPVWLHCSTHIMQGDRNRLNPVWGRRGGSETIQSLCYRQIADCFMAAKMAEGSSGEIQPRAEMLERQSLRTSRRLCTSGPGGSHENWADMVTISHCMLLFMGVTIQNGLWHAFPPGGSFLERPCLVQKVDFFSSAVREKGGGGWWWCFVVEVVRGRKEEGKDSRIVCSSCRNTEGEEWLICMFPLLYVWMCLFSFIMCDILYCSDSWATVSYRPDFKGLG